MTEALQQDSIDTGTVFRDIVQRRKSTRGFKPDPVPQAVLDQVFGTALRAPSNCNTQPWQTHIASGEKLEQLRKIMPEAFMKGEFTMDFPYDGKYEGVYKDRQYASAEALYSAMGIAREEKDKRNVAFMRNFTCFDAPHVAFLFLPEPFGIREACDLGMYAQTLMLSMVAHGLASCPQTALSFMAGQIREVLDIDPSNRLMFGLSFGYEDESHPANGCQTDRGSLADMTHYHS